MKRRLPLTSLLVAILSISCSLLGGASANGSRPVVCSELDTGKTADVFVPNRDYKRRDQLLGLSVDWEHENKGGIEPFERAPLSVIAALYEEHFLDPLESQNASPTAGEILAFMCRYPAVLASGYVVSPKRDDYRVSIDWIEVPFLSVTPSLKSEFEALCQDADEIDTSADLSCWWD